MTEENKDKKRKPLRLNVEPEPARPVPQEGVRQSLDHGKSKRVTVEVRRGSRVSERRPGVPSERFTDEEQLRRLKAVQQALWEKEEIEQLRVLQEQKGAEERELAQQSINDDPKHAEVLEDVKSSDSFSVVQEAPTEGASSDERSVAIDKKRRGAVGRSADYSSPFHAKRSKNTLSEEGSKTFSKRSKLKTDNKLVVPEEASEFISQDAPVAVVGLKKLATRSGKTRRDKVSHIITRCVELTGPVSVQDLAEKIAVKAMRVVQILAKLEHTVTAQSILDVSTAELVISELGHRSVRVGLEDIEASLWNISEGSELKERPPVVTVMGHVDHGKTSLLDALRKSSVASGEKGGITQHIGAYQVCLPSGKRITFIDTPGHEAFMRMRERGAAATDIIVLVVAADDGVKAQTIEAIHHAKTSNVPMIVAINKIDKPGVRPDVVRTELLAHGVLVEKMGGDILDVEVSALTGQNLDQLVETILLQAEMMALTCVQDAKARGVIIETHMRKGHGHVATVLIQNGTLKKGDLFVSGALSGKVRMMFDEAGKTVNFAVPSQPVEVLGFSSPPISGDRFLAVENEAQMRDFTEWKSSAERLKHSTTPDAKSIENIDDLQNYFRLQNMDTLSVIIKADVQGSVEGLEYELQKIKHAEVALNIISSGVGPVNESDVMLARTSGATIVVFNTRVLPDAQKLIDQFSVRVMTHQIIYRALEEIKMLLTKLLAPEEQEHLLGKAEVIKVFHVKKASSIAGCMVKEGLLRRSEKVKIFRGKHMLFEGIAKSLRHVKNDMKEVKFGYECGMILEGFDAFEVGDRVECYETRKIARALEDG